MFWKLCGEAGKTGKTKRLDGYLDDSVERMCRLKSTSKTKRCDGDLDDSIATTVPAFLVLGSPRPSQQTSVSV